MSDATRTTFIGTLFFNMKYYSKSHTIVQVTILTNTGLVIQHYSI